MARLSMEEVNVLKRITNKGQQKLEYSEILDLIDTIESQQQEIDDWKQMGTIASNNNKKLKQEIEQLKSDSENAQQALCVEIAENEQLKAQNKVMRQAVGKAREALHCLPGAYKNDVFFDVCNICTKITECNSSDKDCSFDIALKAIEKVIGGQEDA